MSAVSTSSATTPASSAPSKSKGLWAIIKETISDWMDDNAMRLSAALALYTILSLAPLLVVTVKVVGIVWRDKAAVRTQMVQQMNNLMGPSAAKAIQPMLDNSSHQGSGVLATIISFAVLLFSATGVFIELQDAMNTIWGVKPKPNQGIWLFIRNRLLSLSMVFGIAFLLLVSMFISTALTAMSQSVGGKASWLGHILDIVISIVVITLLFAAIFKFLPDVKILWKEVWLSAVVTAILFTIGKYGLALYFDKAAPTSAFGAAGSLAAVLLWVYYSAFILFFGAEFSKVWSVHHGHRIEPEPHAVKVTEEDRAQRGIPTPERIRQSVAKSSPSSSHPAPPRRPLPASHRPGVPMSPQHMPRPAAAAYIVIMSAIAGSLGLSYFFGKKEGEQHRHA